MDLEPLPHTHGTPRMIHPTRRHLLTAAAGLALPAAAQAQDSLRLGVLTPLTGAGSFDGPRMLKAMQAVATDNHH